jgi:hypothetical protein
MGLILAKGFDPTTYKPLAPLEEWIRHANNSLGSLGLMAEGGTARQSYFINSLTDTPFNIEIIHLYEDDENKYATDIQIYGNPMREFQSPLGTAYLKFYMLSPSESGRIYSVQQDDVGTDIQVPHMTLDEYLNDFATIIDSFVEGDDGDGNITEIEGATNIDRFIKCFSIICNLGTYVIPSAGVGATLTYTDLYYYNQSNLLLRDKIDILVYSELPYNNINVVDTDTPIEVNASEYPI